MKNVVNRVVLLSLMVLFVFSSCCKEENNAKYVFYFIGDGMGLAHVSVTEGYLATKNGEISNDALSFSSFPVMGMATTYSASNYITCSSAAGTALSTGSKTNNGMLGVTPDTTKLESIAYKIHNAGYAVGITSSVTIDHATPAAFYANAAYRGEYYNIAAQLATSNFEFYGGGGFGGVKDARHKENNLYKLAENAGYTLAYGLNDCNAKETNAKKMFLLQEQGKEDNALPFVADREKGDLTLPEVVKEAIEFLESDDKGFFLMAEGGKIDWSAHSNDLAGTIFETLDLDEAVMVAYEFYKKHPEETLIIVTADHETGGLGLGREGYNYDLTVIDNPTVKNAEDETNVSNYMSKSGIDSTSIKAKIGWTSKTHTGIAVPVYAIGAGSELFAGRMDNTDIPKKVCEAMGVQF